MIDWLMRLTPTGATYVQAILCSIMLVAVLVLMGQIAAGMVAMYRDLWGSAPSPRRARHARRKAWRM